MSGLSQARVEERGLNIIGNISRWIGTRRVGVQKILGIGVVVHKKKVWVESVVL